MEITSKQRVAIIVATLLALFLGALDALILSAAMPSVIADLGGLQLYSWVYSTYFLARAVSLPIIGKLVDIYRSRSLFLFCITLFILASTAAGCAGNMTALITARVIQGIGAGGIFALVYVVLADVSTEGSRGRALSSASAIWGIASVLGPTMGGFIVTYFSWRWIFLINIPIGMVCLWGIGVYLKETRRKRESVSLDVWGAATLTTAILSLLFAFLLGGRTFAWTAPPMLVLSTCAALALILFIWIERHAQDPILSIGFFKIRGFATGNTAVFMSSFAIFSLFAYAPLFIQGVQGLTPMRVGIAMLSLSLGWSAGSLALGRFIDRTDLRGCAVTGALFLVAGCIMTLSFHQASTTVYIFSTFFIIGVGMGFVGLATLMVVQACLKPEDLGVATSSNQFARTLGGTMGVGICGSFIAGRFAELKGALIESGVLEHLPEKMAEAGVGQIEGLLQPDIQMRMPPELIDMVRLAVAHGVRQVFWTICIVSILCLLLCAMIPRKQA